MTEDGRKREKIETGPPRNALSDLAIPALALAFTAYYLSTIAGAPAVATIGALTVGSLLAVSVAALLVRLASRLRAGRETLVLPASIRPGRASLRQIGLMGLAGFTVLSIETLGLTLATFVFLLLAIGLVAGYRKPLRVVLVALLVSVLCGTVFLGIFEIRFPAGPVERAIESLRDAG